MKNTKELIIFRFIICIITMLSILTIDMNIELKATFIISAVVLLVLIPAIKENNFDFAEFFLIPSFFISLIVDSGFVSNIKREILIRKLLK